MIIPQQLFEKWKALRSEADTEKIAARVIETGFAVTADTIRIVFRKGKASDEVFKVMAEYYAEKADMIKEYI